ncbi:MAG: helix-turn-helix domain-containing protein [Candidatus Izemoplasmatales bacterium]|jgi:transcriptional regulator with XRE-family HTH domain
MILKEIRRKKKLTLQEMANILEISESQMHRLENNKCKLKVDELAVLRDVLRLTHNEINAILDDAKANKKPQRKRTTKKNN